MVKCCSGAPNYSLRTQGPSIFFSESIMRREGLSFRAPLSGPYMLGYIVPHVVPSVSSFTITDSTTVARVPKSRASYIGGRGIDGSMHCTYVRTYMAPNMVPEIIITLREEVLILAERIL